MNQKILPKAIIVDMDGTLADTSHRNPYDTANCLQDALHHAMRETVVRYHQAGYTIVILTGRDDKWAGLTSQWLHHHNVPYDVLIMRPETMRGQKGPIVKQALFDTQIRDEYDVEWAFDDMTEIIQMWKSIGVPCIQVNDG